MLGEGENCSHIWKGAAKISSQPSVKLYLYNMILFNAAVKCRKYVCMYVCVCVLVCAAIVYVFVCAQILSFVCMPYFVVVVICAPPLLIFSTLTSRKWGQLQASKPLYGYDTCVLQTHTLFGFHVTRAISL